MNKATRTSTEARLLTMAQAQEYTGLGRNYCRKWCEEIGAIRHFGGRMIRADKNVIDEALNRAAIREV